MITEYGKRELAKTAGLANLTGNAITGGVKTVGHAVQDLVDAGIKHPIMVGAPLLGTLLAIASGVRNSPSANISWVNPRNNEYYLKPGFPTSKLDRNPYYGI